MPSYLFPARLQSAINWISGTPEGTVRAPIGTLIVDAVTGDLYQKKTPGTNDSGWVKIGLILGGAGFRLKNAQTNLWHTIMVTGAVGEEVLLITDGEVDP